MAQQLALEIYKLELYGLKKYIILQFKTKLFQFFSHG